MLFTALAACSEPRAPLLDSRFPPAFPIPAGATLVDSVSLGTTTTHIFHLDTAPDALDTALRADLRAGGWPSEGSPITIDGPGFVIRLAIEPRDGGSQLSVATVRGVAPKAAVRPVLTGPPPLYAKGFTFLPGGTLHDERRDDGAGVVEIDYRDLSRAQIATRLRAGAERARWMCTQGDERFVCTIGGRSVDVTLWRKGETVRAVFRATP